MLSCACCSTSSTMIPDPNTGKPHFAMGMVGFFTLGK
jgi:hypothetical protein